MTYMDQILEFAYKQTDKFKDPYEFMTWLKNNNIAEHKSNDRPIQSVSDIMTTKQANCVDIANAVHDICTDTNTPHRIIRVKFSKDKYHESGHVFCMFKHGTHYMAFRFIPIPGKEPIAEIVDYPSLYGGISGEVDFLKPYHDDMFKCNTTYVVNVLSDKETLAWNKYAKKKSMQRDVLSVIGKPHKMKESKEPLYFYHLAPKGADINTIGLMSPSYMYKHKKYDMFDKSVNKYRKRIHDWGLSEKRPEDLTREDIIQAMNKFRNEEDGLNKIYMFRYAPHKGMGKNMDETLAGKDIYRININDPKVQKYIKGIDWGWEGSHTDNKKLTRRYYEKVTPDDYFKNYDDNAVMTFAAMNHIGIIPTKGYLPPDILEKVNESYIPKVGDNKC